MYYYHAIAILPGDRQKSLPNKTEEKMFAEVVGAINKNSTRLFEKKEESNVAIKGE